LDKSSQKKADLLL